MTTPLRFTLAMAMACMGVTPLRPATAQETYWPTHGWRRSSPEAQGMDSRLLADAFDYIRQHNIPIHSLLIVRNGYLVLDAYFWPFQDAQLHDLASVTKSVTSTLVGIVIGQGRLGGVRQPLLSAFGPRPVANRDARKERITLEHLLTMTSGLDCVATHELTLFEMLHSSDWIQFMLDRPMVAEPGARFEYCSGGMHLLSGVITRATGTSSLDFARRELLGPLGITDVAWPADPQGIPNGWGDLHLQPRDMAKIGYLWLNGGRWEGRQLVPSDWLRAATQVHAHPGYSPGQEYGYGIWVYPQRTPPIYEGLGRGGQRISVVPALNLVVVFTGGGFEPGDVGEFIGRAIKSGQALPDDPAGAARLAAAVTDATRPPAPRPLPPAPTIATTITGKTFVLDSNPVRVRALSLAFPGGAAASLRLVRSDGHTEEGPVGLDGVPRIWPDGRFGLPVAVSGEWEGDSIFVLSYDEVGNINALRLRLSFSRDGVSIEMTERTGLMEARWRGRPAD